MKLKESAENAKPRPMGHTSRFNDIDLFALLATGSLELKLA